MTRQYQGIFSAGGRAPRIRENSLGTRLVDLSARGFATHRSLFEIDLWASLDIDVLEKYREKFDVSSEVLSSGS